MSNSEVSIFNFQVHQVRVVEIEGNPWFVAADVCKVLGYTLTGDALRLLDSDEIKMQKVHENRGRPNSVISEPGLYKLIQSSRKPAARAFDRWVRHVVLPAIRKDGGYVMGEEKLATGEMSDDEFLARAVMMAQKKIEEKDAKIAEMEPKARVYDDYMRSDNLMNSTTVAAKVGLRSAQELHHRMRCAKVIKRARRTYVPTAAYAEGGYMQVVTRLDHHGVRFVDQLMWTPKGLALVDQILRDNPL